ncbi:hypothetical protein VIGAN_02095400 [Vigna angularis var. angularis]|uniref:Uncharacterized protein n=1 Tax=Vigna angularis var. angularis TaxID=157739 RepID=A0A0S3RC17_PHAAN|nr:hypothetical protein VIGAN_02095400 [Vigna angularis var. angularis]
MNGGMSLFPKLAIDRQKRSSRTKKGSWFSSNNKSENMVFPNHGVERYMSSVPYLVVQKSSSIKPESTQIISTRLLGVN